eukprot:3551608-Alexandrium_andersonii.AAC.1
MAQLSVDIFNSEQARPNPRVVLPPPKAAPKSKALHLVVRPVAKPIAPARATTPTMAAVDATPPAATPEVDWAEEEAR